MIKGGILSVLPQQKTEAQPKYNGVLFEVFDSSGLIFLILILKLELCLVIGDAIIKILCEQIGKAYFKY